jgi:glycosyltransferase involved in cell wall biosynthesis
MLDTIGWDVLYPSGAGGLGTVWRFIARHADGLLFISHFTRERFNARFPVAAGVAEQVTHLSLLAGEHIDPVALNAPASDDILVFGNELDHKDVRQTAQLLIDAFPFNRIVAFGISDVVGSNAVAIPSGGIEQTELHRLIAGARLIVYPSFYEGFGLPVVEGLAYGRPVVVRHSPLWAEIAGWSRMPGHLIEFDDTPSLVESVGRVLAGLPHGALPSGSELANQAAPPSWKDCAGRVMSLMNECITVANGSKWVEREEALLLARL